MDTLEKCGVLLSYRGRFPELACSTDSAIDGLFILLQQQLEKDDDPPDDPPFHPPMEPDNS